ncbi:hypothetical protein SKAU_G00359920 [Synaphobranchus kaupii]|uniref:Uncharacterized protein n=1 Tax=Synaphobranchus kaupii TaxID=118154 RepID=A0A9Q1EI45_SYNKA|nr:hypothetical protein SKAU_G00359920 [Synaphobranchus kaupii]
MLLKPSGDHFRCADGVIIKDIFHRRRALKCCEGVCSAVYSLLQLETPNLLTHQASHLRDHTSIVFKVVDPSFLTLLDCPAWLRHSRVLHPISPVTCESLASYTLSAIPCSLSPEVLISPPFGKEREVRKGACSRKRRLSAFFGRKISSPAMPADRFRMFLAILSCLTFGGATSINHRGARQTVSRPRSPRRSEGGESSQAQPNASLL